MIGIVVLLLFCTLGHLEGFHLNRVKRATDQELIDSFSNRGRGLNFNTTVVPDAPEHRKFACLFIFDKEASDALNGKGRVAHHYANQLAEFASLYTAHANIEVVNAGVEMWSDGDRISFIPEENSYSSPIQDFLPRLQMYLNYTQRDLFGTVYTVAILISNKNSTLISGGYTQGPPNTTSAASIINFRPYPWNIAGLLAHELAHTLCVVHPMELEYACEDYPDLPFSPSVTSKPIPEECICNSLQYPAQQCLMTYMFGKAYPDAPRYTSCDIQMMKYFASRVLSNQQ